MKHLVWLSVCLIVFGHAGTAQSNAEKRAVDISGFFKRYCIIPLQRYVQADVGDLYRFTPEETKALAQNLGMNSDGWAVWSPPKGGHVLSLKDEADPNPCTVSAFSVDAGIWTELLNGLQSLDGVRSQSDVSPPSDTPKNARLRRSWVGAVHLTKTDFLQISATLFGQDDKALLSLVGVRVTASPFACSLFPQTC